jgi:hypothetical protein
LIHVLQQPVEQLRREVESPNVSGFGQVQCAPGDKAAPLSEQEQKGMFDNSVAYFKARSTEADVETTMN